MFMLSLCGNLVVHVTPPFLEYEARHLMAGFSYLTYRLLYSILSSEPPWTNQGYE